MPTRNTGETPGGTTKFDILEHDIRTLKTLWNGPDWIRTISREYIIPANTNYWLIPAGGWLTSVCIRGYGQENEPTDNGYYRARFEITDPVGSALWGQFTWMYHDSSCGFTFMVPVPNMDAAAPYVLHRIDTGACPKLTVIVQNLAPKGF